MAIKVTLVQEALLEAFVDPPTSRVAFKTSTPISPTALYFALRQAGVQIRDVRTVIAGARKVQAALFIASADPPDVRETVSLKTPMPDEELAQVLVSYGADAQHTMMLIAEAVVSASLREGEMLRPKEPHLRITKVGDDLFEADLATPHLEVPRWVSPEPLSKAELQKKLLEQDAHWRDVADLIHEADVMWDRKQNAQT